MKGSFYYTQGWLDLGIDLGQSDIERKRSEYMEKYEDEDTVEYLLEMDREMLKHYRYLTYIAWPGMHNERSASQAGELAQKSSLELLHYEGSSRLMADFVNGNWNEEDFLILRPGEVLQPSYDSRIIKGVR